MTPSGRRDALVNRRRNRQTRFLASSILLEEIGPPRILTLMLFLVVGAVGALVAWSAVAPLTERVAAAGQVVPTGSVLAVQHLEGGIVAEIAAREGGLVEKGDVLLRLDRSTIAGEYEEARTRIAALALRAERLRAFAEARPPDFAAVDLPGAYPGLVADQRQIYEFQIRKSESERKVLEHVIEQRREDLNSLNSQIEALAEETAILTELVSMREKLARRGLISKVVLLGTKQQLVSVRGALRKHRADAIRAQQAIAESREKLVQRDSELQSVAISEMGVVAAELAQHRRLFAKLEDRMARLEIRAPIRGIVKGLVPNTVGGVIAPGSRIADIVPVNDELVAEIRISAPDIGQVVVGQPVSVKFSAYDFYRYGGVEGELVQVSASTFQDDDGVPYYRGRIRLNAGHVGAVPSANRILPGMTIDADIKTGQRTVLQYLMKPIYLSISDAFKEH